MNSISFADELRILHAGRWLRPQLCLSKRNVPAFRLCGLFGFCLACAQSFVVVHIVGLSELILLGIMALAVLSFFVIAIATKVIAGNEILVYYHCEIVVIAATTLALKLLHQPVLAYLDVTVLAMGVFLSFGRIGCLMVGCCHGRPSRVGVIYGEEHVRAGFPGYLSGVRLSPVQALESVFVLLLVVVCLSVIVGQHLPGAVFGLYVVGYAVGRFVLEFFRGDAARPYLYGFSEAQWTSLVLCFGEVWAGHLGWLPRGHWDDTILVIMALAMVAVSARRRWQNVPRFELLHPKHLREIAEAVRSMRAECVPHVARTRMGFLVSCGEISSDGGLIRHYTVSHANAIVLAPSVDLLARVIGRLFHPDGRYEVVAGGNGVYHLIYMSAAAQELESAQC